MTKVPLEPAKEAGSSIRSLVSAKRLEDFFGQKPRLEYPRLPYRSNLITVESERKHGNVWLQLMPLDGWAQLRVQARPFSLLKLDLADISRIHIRKGDVHPSLVFSFNAAQVSELVLYLEPSVMVFWGNDPAGH